MNVEILYLALPLACLLCGAERVGVLLWRKRRGRSPRGVGESGENPCSPLCAALLSAVEMIFALLAAAALLCGLIWPLLALFFGHSARAFARYAAAFRRRSYAPGLVCFAALAPYWALGVGNMLVRFPASVCFALALGGTLFVFLSERLFRRFFGKNRAGNYR